MNKIRTLIVFITLFAISFINAQSHFCGTDQGEQFMTDLRVNKKYFEQTRNKKRVERFIPVTFHSVATTQGEGRVNDALIYDALCTLNSRFEETEMRFFLRDINHINNTLIYSDSRGAQGQNAMRNFLSNNSVNVFIVDDAGAGVAGFYRRSDDLVVMIKNTLSDVNYTLEHEIGHFFTLPHTHRGWDQISGDPNIPNGGYNPAVHGDTVRIRSVSSSQSGTVAVELVDGSNCTTAGDEICDTPPDYGFGFTCNCCSMIFNVWDFNGDRIEPMIDNVMSYSDDCVPYRFSEEQSIAMMTDFDGPRRNYLRSGELLTTFNPIRESAELISPAGPIVENFNGIFFDWEDVPNAERYILKIDGDQDLEYIVSDSEFFVEDLQANSTYFWQVTPLNGYGSSCLSNDVRLFQTRAGTTSVNNIEGVTNVSVHPNPTSQGLDLNVFITAENTTDAQVSVFDINGKASIIQSETIQSGDNQIKIKTASLITGLYIIEVQTETGRLTEKVFIK
jgi:hypothetical protein